MIATKAVRPIHLNIASFSTIIYRKITHNLISEDNSSIKIYPFFPTLSKVHTSLMLKYNFSVYSEDFKSKSGAEKTSIYLIKHAAD